MALTVRVPTPDPSARNSDAIGAPEQPADRSGAPLFLVVGVAGLLLGVPWWLGVLWLVGVL